LNRAMRPVAGRTGARAMAVAPSHGGCVSHTTQRHPR
jgi:hypothetical protein